MLVSNAADAILITNTLAEYRVKLKAIISTGGGHADPSLSRLLRKVPSIYLISLSGKPM